MKRVWHSAPGSRRTGKGLFPPNPTQWQHERHALDLRQVLGIPLDTALSHADAFALLPDVHVFPLGELPVELEHLRHLRGPGSGKVSGLAVPLPGDLVIVAYNDAHPINRVRTTLMEEFFHIRLGHPPSTLRLHAVDGRRRTFNSEIEREAYHSGAAALLPYVGLKGMATAGSSVPQIARHFQVSQDLVWFRANVTRTRKLLRTI